MRRRLRMGCERLRFELVYQEGKRGLHDSKANCKTQGLPGDKKG